MILGGARNHQTVGKGSCAEGLSGAPASFTLSFNPAPVLVERQDSRRTQASKLLSDKAKKQNFP